MSNPYWIYENDKPRIAKSYVVQLMPKDLVWASSSPKGMQNVIARLRGGGDAELKKPAVLSRSAIVAVDYEEGSNWVRVRDGADRKHSVFTAETAAKAAETARALAGHLGLPAPATASPATIASITTGPGIGAAVVLVMTFLLYFAAEPGGSETKRYGRAGTMQGISNALGQTGVLLIGALLLLACVGYWLYLFNNRPKVHSFGKPMSV